MNGAVVALGGLALFGLSHLVPAVPGWAAPAWLALYVAGSVFFWWPFTLWKSQQAQIAAQTIVDDHITIRDLFFTLTSDPAAHKEHIGAKVMDWMATGELPVLGREIRGNRTLPLDQIDKSYWKRATLTYRFLESEDAWYEAHVADLEIGRPQYADLQFDRGRALSLCKREPRQRLARLARLT